MYVEDIWFESWPVHHPSELKFLLLLVKQQLQNEPDDHLHIVKNTNLHVAWLCFTSRAPHELCTFSSTVSIKISLVTISHCMTFSAYITAFLFLYCLWWTYIKLCNWRMSKTVTQQLPTSYLVLWKLHLACLVFAETIHLLPYWKITHTLCKNSRSKQKEPELVTTIGWSQKYKLPTFNAHNSSFITKIWNWIQVLLVCCNISSTLWSLSFINATYSWPSHVSNKSANLKHLLL